MNSLTERAERFALNLIESNADAYDASHAFPLGNASPADRLDHGRQVAALLKEWGAGPQLQTAGLLHSLIWGRTLSPAEAAELGDAHVSFLCQEYQRILEKKTEGKGQSQGQGQSFSLKLVKFLVLGYGDRDLALLGAADLWSHYQLSKSGNADHRAKYQQIARQILCPYLHFLGMAELENQLWIELDVAAATAMDPEAQITPVLENDAVFAYVQGLTHTHLPGVALVAEPVAALANRASQQSQSHDSKSEDGPSSLPTSGSPNPKLPRHYGLLVESNEDCFQTLYRLHQFFIPEAGTVRDSITHCQPNGYRSLQTTVLHEDLPIQFEIYTRSMDKINRWGLAAAHLKKGSSSQHLATSASSAAQSMGGQNPENQDSEYQNEALSTAWWNQTDGKFDRIESAYIGALSEILYVFSSSGKLHEFYRGATVVDYAYSVDSKQAAHCRRFFVNGEAVEPATILHHLDLVDLEYDPSAPGPTRVWRSAAFTPAARSAIDLHLKHHGEGAVHAQQVIDDRLKELETHYGFRMSEERVNQGISQEVKQRNLPSKESLLAEISTARLHVDRILHPLFATEILRQIQIPPSLSLRPHQLILGECCRPKPGDEIVGAPHRHEGIIDQMEIHGIACELATSEQADAPVDAQAADASPVDTLIPLQWRLQPNSRTVAQIEMRALDEERLLADAINQIHEVATDVVLHRSAFLARNGGATVRFVLEAPSREVIDTIADGLQNLPNRTVDEVYQIDLPLSEQRELVQSDSAAQANPYTRMPVYEEGMFFGRLQELNEIRDWLRSHIGIIWLVGQKRVGKTSLMLHLKNHVLDRAEYTPVYLDFQILHSLEPVDITFEIASTVYVELQNAGHSGGHSTELGPPLRTMFEYDPMSNLIRYLKSAQSNPQVGKIVLLIDEFSRTTDAHRSGDLDENFFTQWRGLVQMTQPGIKFIIVVQQQAFNQMNKQGSTINGAINDAINEDPSWHLMELGETQHLRPLTEKDARNLIEWPIRNYMQATPELLDRIHALTGSSPFLIQSFCFKLVSHMMRLNKGQLEWSDLDMVRMELLSPTESIFAHLLDMIQGSTNAMCVLVAKIADQELQKNSRATPLVAWSQIASTYPVFLSNRLRSSLNDLCDRHILIAVERNGTESWRFSSILFQEWLALNVDEESKLGDFRN